MNKRKLLQLPAEPGENSIEAESALTHTMQQWLNDARTSDDARDRIAVAVSISRGAFGRLHLGTDCSGNDVFVESEEIEKLKFSRVA